MSETRMKWTVDVAKGRFAIQGMVTNGGELAPLLEKAAPAASITMDLGGLRAFTSSGVQGWLRFLDALREKGCVVVFERCSPAVVKQTMAISDFLAGGQVRSLLAPWVCTRCDGEAEEEVVVGAAKEGTFSAARRCKCGAEMEFDDLKQPYVELLREAAARAAG
jgi:hypothetical protein